MDADLLARVQPALDFVLELEKLKAVTRKNKPLGLERYENSAEHSWQIALLAAAVAHLAAEPVRVERVVMMLLLHDIGEIDTGDTMIYVEGGWEERKAAEWTAVQRIAGLLGPVRAAPFLELWREFEDGVTPEARFAHAVDRAMPALQNLHNQGQSWRENGITHAQVVGRIGPPIRDGCPALWAAIEARLDQALREGWFGMA